MLGVQPPTKLKRRGSWIIRRSKEEGESVRKRDKEDEKLFLKLKRDNANCADCSAKGAKHASVKPGVLLCLECAGAHLSLGLPIKLIKDLDHADLERTVAMYNGAANSILESAIKLKKPSQTEPFDGRRAFVAAKYVDMAFRGNQTYPHDLTPQVYKDVVKAGYVHMKENNKLWPRLYCVLTTYLSFYRLPTDTLPELVLELRFSSVLPVTTYPGGCRIKIITPSTSNHLVLQADSAADAQEWLSVLQMVCKIVLSEDEKASQATMEDDAELLAAPLHEELDLDTKKNEETSYDMMTMSGSNLARQRSFTNLILMEGPLLTMSHSKVWKEWRKRWFVLSRDHLRIFKSKQDTRSGAKPHTTVRLLQCSVKASDRFEDKKLCFEITTPEQSILVLAENADEMRNWIFTIRQASGRMLAEAMSDASILGQGELPAEDLGMTSSGELPPHQMQMSPERSPMRSSSSLLIEKQAEVVAAPSGPICEGFLYKRKSPAKSGKRVWAALKVDSLYIYKHQGDATPLEFVNLLTSSVKVVDPVNHCFDVVLPNAAFHLQAENANDLALWMAALRGIIESLLSNFKKSSASSSPARPRAMSASVVPDSRLTRQSQPPPTLMTSSADEMSLEDHGSDELVEDDRVLKPQALLDALAESDNDVCADCGEKDPRWVSINLGLYLCIECSGIHRSLGVHISKVRSIELDLWDKDTIQFMLDMGNKKANAIWEHCVPPEFEARRPGPASDRTTREEWTKHKYIKKTFANLAEIARFEATRALLPATAGASNGFVSPRSVRSVSQRSIQRTGPVAANPWRPWQGVAKKKKSQYREGYLNQRGKISKAWAKRWFVLKTSVLFYYKVRGDNQPAGVIDLNECSLRKSETAKKANSFEIVSPTRVYVLYADTDASFKEWISALNKAVGMGNGLQLDKQSPVAQRTGSLSPTGHNPSSPRRRGSIASSREAWVTAQYRTDSDANLLKSALTGVADSGAVEEADTAPTVSRVRSPSFGHQRIRANSLEPPKPNKMSEPIPNAVGTEKQGETKEEDRSPEPTADTASSDADQSTNENEKEKENEEDEEKDPAHGEHA